MTIETIARSLGVHRSIAYRLVRTLEHHRLVTRDAAGQIRLGGRLAALAAGVARDLQTASLPELSTLANDVGCTAYLAVLDEADCVTLMSVEPRKTLGVITQRPGTKHSVDLGASGRALLSQMPADLWPVPPIDLLRARVDEGRVNGFHVSHGEVLPSMTSVAVPLALPFSTPATVGLVFAASARPTDDLGERLRQCAAAHRERLGQ